MYISKFKESLLVVVGVALLAVWLFIYIALEVTENGSGDLAWTSVDQNIVNIFATVRSPLMTEVMMTITYLGSMISVSLIALTALLISHFKNFVSERRILFFSSLGSILFIRTTKIFFGRARPSPETWLTSANGLSFPSGHSAGSFAVLGAVFFILGRGCEKQYQRWLIWSLGALVILLIGLSRIYLGVHYPTDVLGGYLLGFSILIISIALDRYRDHQIVINNAG